jgi:hypothetical protein
VTKQLPAGARSRLAEAAAAAAAANVDNLACRNTTEQDPAGARCRAANTLADAAAETVEDLSGADAAGADDDVESFLDGLLQQAAAKKQGTPACSRALGKSATAAAAAAATSRPGTAGSAAARAGKQQQKGKAKPAWALTEQQQAEAAAAAAAAASDEAADDAAEEAELLQFAEGLSWEQLVGQMDDEQLAAAFQVGQGVFYWLGFFVLCVCIVSGQAGSVHNALEAVSNSKLRVCFSRCLSCAVNLAMLQPAFAHAGAGCSRAAGGSSSRRSQC